MTRVRIDNIERKGAVLIVQTELGPRKVPSGDAIEVEVDSNPDSLVTIRAEG